MNDCKETYGTVAHIGHGYAIVQQRRVHIHNINGTRNAGWNILRG